jgi:uncharacterized protein (DUF1015 family)
MNIKPFRGYRYRQDVVGDLSSVVAPPYDQIGPETQATLYGMSPWNIVRITLSRDSYAAARAMLDAWRRDRVVEREPTSAIYPYHQQYVIGGRSITRQGFVALGEVSDYSEKIVRPHERTHAGPKLDRLGLLEATRADIGLLFMLVDDPGGVLREATEPGGPPLVEVRDLRGETHRLWRISDAKIVERIRAFMADRTVIIADGHHRYEAAVEYGRQHPDARDKLMAFFALDAPGLTILANHRLVHDVDEFSLDRLLADAARWFDVVPLREAIVPGPAMITVVAGKALAAAALRLRPDALGRIPWPAGTSAAWRRLAVSVLHEGLLKPFLDITDEKLDRKTHVDYTADADEAIALVGQGRYQAAFLIPPTTPEELRTVVAGGEVLPQKSTHFYPKLLDGLVFHQLDDA